MIRKLPSGEYRLYSRKTDPVTGEQGTETARPRLSSLFHPSLAKRSRFTFDAGSTPMLFKTGLRLTRAAAVGPRQ